MLDPRKVASSLKKKDFIEDKGKHHVYYYFSVDGKITSVKTYISHGAKEIDKYLVSRMSQQLHLPRNRFLDLIECPMSRDDFRQHLVARNLINLADYIN